VGIFRLLPRCLQRPNGPARRALVAGPRRRSARRLPRRDRARPAPRPSGDAHPERRRIPLPGRSPRRSACGERLANLVLRIRRRGERRADAARLRSRLRVRPPSGRWRRADAGLLGRARGDRRPQRPHRDQQGPPPLRTVGPGAAAADVLRRRGIGHDRRQAPRRVLPLRHGILGRRPMTRRFVAPVAALAALAALPLATPATAQKAEGLALTPPMGWNSWNHYGCNIDETLIRRTADAIVAS